MLIREFPAEKNLADVLPLYTNILLQFSPGMSESIIVWLFVSNFHEPRRDLEYSEIGTRRTGCD